MPNQRRKFEPRPLDEISIEWFRRALVLTWIWTLVIRLQDLTAHYSDDGVLPRALLASSDWKFSLNMYFGSNSGQLAIFAVSIAAALANALGWRRPWTALVMWLTGISIFSRNELVMNGADHYFSMLLLWNFLLSWPRARRAASLGYTFQIVMLYFFTGLAKSHFDAWTNGSAIRDILNLDILTRPWSQQLVAYEPLMKGMTWSTLAIEFSAAIALSAATLASGLGWRHFDLRTRRVTIVCLAMLHLGIMAMLKLYFIPIMSLVSLIPLWPSAHDSSVAPKRKASSESAPLWQTWAIVLLSCIFLASNMQGDPRGLFVLPKLYQAATAAFRLDQNWTFYAPPPTAGFDGWWVFDGLTENNEHVDAWTGRAGPVESSKPKELSNYYLNQHWTAYFINLTEPQNERFLSGLLAFLCRESSKVRANDNVQKITAERFYSIYDARPVSAYRVEHSCEVSGLY